MALLEIAGIPRFRVMADDGRARHQTDILRTFCGVTALLHPVRISRTRPARRPRIPSRAARPRRTDRHKLSHRARRADPGQHSRLLCISRHPVGEHVQPVACRRLASEFFLQLAVEFLSRLPLRPTRLLQAFGPHPIEWVNGSPPSVWASVHWDRGPAMRIPARAKGWNDRVVIVEWDGPGGRDTVVWCQAVTRRDVQAGTTRIEPKQGDASGRSGCAKQRHGSRHIWGKQSCGEASLSAPSWRSGSSWQAVRVHLRHRQQSTRQEAVTPHPTRWSSRPRSAMALRSRPSRCVTSSTR